MEPLRYGSTKDLLYVTINLIKTTIFDSEHFSNGCTHRLHQPKDAHSFKAYIDHKNLTQQQRAKARSKNITCHSIRIIRP